MVSGFGFTKLPHSIPWSFSSSARMAPKASTAAQRGFLRSGGSRPRAPPLERAWENEQASEDEKEGVGPGIHNNKQQQQQQQQQQQ